MSFKATLVALLVIAFCLCFVEISNAQITTTAHYYPRAGIVCSKAELAVQAAEGQKHTDKFKSSVSIPKEISFSSTFYTAELLSDGGSFSKEFANKSFKKSYDFKVKGNGSGKFTSLTCHYGKAYKGDLAKLNNISFVEEYTIEKADKPISQTTTATVVKDSEIFLNSATAKYSDAKDSKNTSRNVVVFDLAFQDNITLADLVDLRITSMGRNLFDGDFSKVIINKEEYPAKVSVPPTTVQIDIKDQKKSFGKKITIEFPTGYLVGSKSEFTPFEVGLITTKGTDFTDMFYTGKRSSSGTSPATVFVIILLIVVIIAAAFFVFRCLIAKKCGKKKSRENDSESDVYGLLA